MKLPEIMTECYIKREEYGWSVFYRDERYDDRVLYEKCTLQEAGNVVQEWYDHPESTVTEATVPEHYKT